MAREIKLPKLGKTMQDAIIGKCSVQTGDKISKGQCLFEIETDKVTFEIESPQDGFVKAVLVEPGQKTTVGQTLLILGEQQETVKVPTKNQPRTVASDSSKQVAKPITTDKIIEAIKDNTAGARDCNLGQKITISKLSKINSQQMLSSKNNIPCFYLNISADVTDLIEYKNNLNNPEISFDDFLVKALADSLCQWPVMTGVMAQDENNIHLADSVNIAFAIAVGAGQIAAVIKNADKKNITEIASSRKALIDKAQKAILSADDIEGACITISNLGNVGVDSFIPIVLPGQCSGLGVGKITETCIAGRKEISIRKIVKLTLAVDHKIANGAEAAQFFNSFVKLLDQPEKLAE